MVIAEDEGEIDGRRDPHKEVELRFWREMAEHGITDAQATEAAGNFRRHLQGLDARLAEHRFLLVLVHHSYECDRPVDTVELRAELVPPTANGRGATARAKEECASAASASASAVPVLQRFIAWYNNPPAAAPTRTADRQMPAVRIAAGGDALDLGGGAPDPRVGLTTGPLVLQPLLDLVSGPGRGGICTFTGTVRDNFGGRPVTRLEYEAYEDMALTEMGKLCDEVEARWPGVAVAMHHRLGILEIGDAAVIVAAAGPHRGESFAACRHGIDTPIVVPVSLRGKLPVPIRWDEPAFARGRYNNDHPCHAAKQ